MAETQTPKILEPLKPLRAGKVALVGFSETTRHLAPFDDPDYEIWVCNRLGPIIDNREKHGPFGKNIDGNVYECTPRWDRHFDPHSIFWSSTHLPGDLWPEYQEWFQRDHGERLVYLPTTESDFPIPNAVEFPRDRVLEEVGREYITSAIGWQIGLALALGAKEIALYGIDLRHISEYEYQRPNAEWLLGVAEGRGVKVILPDTSALLNADKRSGLYGYDAQSDSFGSLEKLLEKRVYEVHKKIQEIKDSIELQGKALQTWDGARQEAEGWLSRIQQYRRGGAL